MVHQVLHRFDDQLGIISYVLDKYTGGFEI